MSMVFYIFIFFILIIFTKRFTMINILCTYTLCTYELVLWILGLLSQIILIFFRINHRLLDWWPVTVVTLPSFIYTILLLFDEESLIKKKKTPLNSLPEPNYSPRSMKNVFFFFFNSNWIFMFLKIC